MRAVIQVALGLVIVAAAVRAAYFLAYAANMIGLPLEVYYLEAEVGVPLLAGRGRRAALPGLADRIRTSPTSSGRSTS